MKKAILYIREDHPENQTIGQTTVEQEKILRNYCNESQITIVKAFIELGARNDFQRTQFEQIMKEITSGHIEADLLLFTRIEVLSNSPILYYHLSKDIKTAFGITLKAIGPGICPCCGSEY
jgi:DNA invertase Pin-like site-specific DNA recombinase